MTLKQSIHDDVMPVECAIARAGEEVMLCLEKREGRAPIKAIHIDGNEISWVCADGKIESPFMSGETAQKDMADIIKEASENELLVSEFSEDDAPVHWLMSQNG